MQMMDTLTNIRENIPITVCVFNNGQWGAEKKNQVSCSCLLILISLRVF